MSKPYSNRQTPNLQFLIDSIQQPTDECILWPFKKNKLGYGKILRHKKEWRVHRLAYKLANTDFDETLFILHRCDNPACYNPRHLFQGTQLDNMRDMDHKGRRGTGHIESSKHWCAKLTESQVIEIRFLHRNGVKQIHLASQFHVTPTNINAVIKRKIWKDI